MSLDTQQCRQRDIMGKALSFELGSTYTSGILTEKDAWLDYYYNPGERRC